MQEKLLFLMQWQLLTKLTSKRVVSKTVSNLRVPLWTLFLASIQTKSELTKYPSEKLVQQLKVDYVAIHHKCLITNIPNLDPSYRNYSHKEADTEIVLNALNVSKRDY